MKNAVFLFCLFRTADYIIKSMLTQYLNYISLERGLSDNTRQAYEHDVRLFLDYLADGGLRPEKVKLDDLHRFAWQLHDMGIAPRSVARVLSGVRLSLIHI